MEYSNWTREQLLEKLLSMEKKGQRRKKPRNQRPFDFENTYCRKVAFRICYIGTNYHGFSSAKGDTVDTVEAHLFHALETSKLIPSISGCFWSRCGRTDKGVSGFGQTCSLWIRTKLDYTDNRAFKWSEIAQNEEMFHQSLKDPLFSVDDIKSPNEFEGEEELNYLSMMNRLLPNDIRVLAWSPVNEMFDARFCCSYRTYHYYFASGGLDLENMQKAASNFIGVHDCRHVCKIDTNKVGVKVFKIETELFH
jgi:tRNA pseudouridine38/39 synthase